MSEENIYSENEDLTLAELEAYRTGEESAAHVNTENISPLDSPIIEDLNRISERISQAKPDSNEIPESVDNIVLGHIRQKSRKIRRSMKVIRLFPRWEWAAASAMVFLACVVSFHTIYGPEKTRNIASNEKSSQLSASIFKDIDGNGRIDIIDAYLMDRKLASGGAMTPALDLNRDTHINHRDLEIIVETAVSLHRRDA